MSEKKILAITGATGAQGGNLAHAILNDPQSEFAVRAITRKPHSEKAAALRQLGAEVVFANLDDVESLKRAFAGAYGAFCVTNFWEHFSPERETAQAENLAEAARAARLRHVIWSTLEDTRQWIPLEDKSMPTLQGKYKVPHFDAKGVADRFFTERALPVTLMRTSFYWENFIHFAAEPQRGPDGVLALTLPMGDKPMPCIAVEDIGKCAYGIFRRGTEYIGKTVGLAGEHLTIAEMAAAMSRYFGEEVRYNAVSPEVFRSFGFPGADDLGNMIQFKHDFNELYRAHRNLEESRALNPELQTFEQWLAKNHSRIPVAAPLGA